MIFGKKRLQQFETDRLNYGQFLFKRFKANRSAFWSLRVLYFLIFVALFADFLANEKPLLCKVERKIYFPILKQYAVDLGMSQWDPTFQRVNWREIDYDFVIWPLSAYSPNTIDRSNINYAHPFKSQSVSTWRVRHWLGTDKIGRDVASGLIHGTRTALLVGILAMSIASMIGIVLGSIAGFFGDQSIQISWMTLISLLIGIVLGLFWSSAFATRTIWGGLIGKFFVGLFFFLITVSLFILLGQMLSKIPGLKKRLFLPLDLIIMRVIEIFNSIPGLLLLYALIALVEQPSIWTVILIIGLIRWTGIARFTRAEMLRIKNLEYIQAGKTLGFSRWRLLFRHAIPNAISPVMIAIAFGIASAVLLEAALSFIGLGIASDQVTWGNLLNQARSATKAWWLAVFPGSAIFLTVTIFNLIGEGLSEAMQHQ